MPTQLEIVMEAIRQNGPMTAEELGAVLKANGSKAERPENSVVGLVSTTPELVNVGGTPPRYGLKSDGNAPVGRERRWENGTCALWDIGNLEALFARMRKDSKLCASEADCKDKLVLPLLRDLLKYGNGDFRLEASVNDAKSEKLDILVGSERKPRFFVEVKRIGRKLTDAREQLQRYFRNMDRPCPVGIVTDGIEWHFYLRVLRNGQAFPLLYAALSVRDPKDYGPLSHAFGLLAADSYDKATVMAEANRMAEEIAEMARDADFNVLVSEFCANITAVEHSKWNRDDFKEAASVAVAAVRKWAETRKKTKKT
jgi:hypothetical protein